jgi:hypothetical protein
MNAHGECGPPRMDDKLTICHCIPLMGGVSERQGGGSWPKQNPRSALVRGAIARCPRAGSTVGLTAKRRLAAHQPPATVDIRSVLLGTSGGVDCLAWFCDVDCDATTPGWHRIVGDCRLSHREDKLNAAACVDSTLVPLGVTLC